MSDRELLEMAATDQVQAALDRMSTPLHESRLGGVTAKEDMRCMQIIRDEIERLRAELDALRGQEPANEDLADVVSKALRRAWQLGQTYWQQADSEYVSQNKKADETEVKFRRLVDETRSAVLAPQPAPLSIWTATHLKTGSEYRVTGERTNATNVPVQPGALMIDYERDGVKYAREAGEFMEKFAAKETAK